MVDTAVTVGMVGVTEDMGVTVATVADMALEWESVVVTEWDTVAMEATAWDTAALDIAAPYTADMEMDTAQATVATAVAITQVMEWDMGQRATALAMVAAVTVVVTAGNSSEKEAPQRSVVQLDRLLQVKPFQSESLLGA